MKKAKIFKPTKTAMQSGLAKTEKWVIEYIVDQPGINPLMGWESSDDTNSEIRLEFETKDQAVNFAKKNNIEYYIVEPQKRKLIKKTYADNFLK